MRSPPAATNPQVRRSGHRAVVSEGEAWGELWREHQDHFFQAQGLGIRVDPLDTHAQAHIGPVRMRRVDAAAVARGAELRQANEAAARDPDQVLATLTRNNATFTVGDLDRHLARRWVSACSALRAASASAEPRGQLFIAPLAQLPRADIQFSGDIGQRPATLDQALNRLDLILTRKPSPGSSLCHFALLGCSGSLQNPPPTGEAHLGFDVSPQTYLLHCSMVLGSWQDQIAIVNP